MHRRLKSVAVLVLALTLLSQVLNGFAQHGTYTRPLSFSDYWAQVAERVAGFGGAFLGPEGRIHVYLADPDPTREAAVVQALVGVFGEEVFTETTGVITLLQGDFAIGDLAHMKGRLVYLLDSDGVLYIDLDESQNSLVIVVEDEVALQMVPLHLRVQGIPEGAATVEILPRPAGLELATGEELLQELVREWQREMQSARLQDLPGVGSVAYIWHDFVVPFRIELASPGFILLVARELRALGVPLSAVLLYERE